MGRHRFRSTTVGAVDEAEAPATGGMARQQVTVAAIRNISRTRISMLLLLIRGRCQNTADKAV